MSVQHERLIELCNELRLGGIAAQYPALAQTAAEKRTSFTDFQEQPLVAERESRRARAREMFARVASLCNDVGLIADEYDPVLKRQLGNFPQAFTHVSLVNSAYNLSQARGPAHRRAAGARRRSARSAERQLTATTRRGVRLRER